MKYEVGQKLVAVYTHNARTPQVREAEVSKVGRKWVQINVGRFGADRFDPTDGRIDGKGYSSPGRVYANMDEYQGEVSRREKWSCIYQMVRGSVPAHLTTADLDAILAILEK